jgi:hypothetical protein
MDATDGYCRDAIYRVSTPGYVTVFLKIGISRFFLIILNLTTVKKENLRLVFLNNLLQKFVLKF